MEQLGSLGVEKERRVQVLSPRSKAVTFDMEGLSLEPSNSFPSIKERKNALQLRLQQRRTREQLVDQGIMPPLKTPAAFHDQIRSLERARTETFLKHKICSRPERAELVRMHILQETQAEPSLQARQMKLKRARLADDLNEKIAQRPGPMELVEKNILPVDSSVKEAITGEVNYQKTPDVYCFDEDSCDALSSEDPASQELQCSVPSPREAKLPEFSSATPTAGSNVQPSPPTSRSSEFSQVSEEGQANPQAITPAHSVTTVPAIRSGPTLVKQSHPKHPSERNRNKKSKETKPRVKKLKYHQYIPPDQKQEPSEAPMDSAYARLLQQQQQFLHLQILSQQQQHFSYQAILPATASKAVPETQGSCCNVAMGSSQGPIVLSLSCPTPGHVSIMSSHKPGPLPANLEEMKVAELKVELKFRGLPVSGTKTDLIERLKPYQERPKSSSTQLSVTKNTVSALASPQSESMTTAPPASPVHSDVSSGTVEETGDSKALSPSFSKAEDTPAEASCDKDQRLHEKERQIEELMRKLEQEQRLVEELKMQLEVEKRNQQGAQHPQANPDPPAHIKEERDASSSCSTTMNQEEFYVAPQGVEAPQTILGTQSGHHILLPTTIHLPQTQQVLQTTMSVSAQSIIQTPLLQPLKTETTTFQQNQTQAGPQPPSPCQSTYILPHSPFSNHHSPKSKDPPRYEEAVKQTRALQATMQVPTATSQHMDDLFDVLIESGEISPLIQQDHLSEDKPLPVTASVTTLPINTALSRPPPQVQVAHMPSLVALASDHQLEALLEDTLVPVTESRSLCMVEDLLLEPRHSLMDTSELSSSDSPSTSLHLHETNLDNMEWLDLTVPGPVGISTPACVFSSGFLDSHALHWD